MFGDSESSWRSLYKEALSRYTRKKQVSSTIPERIGLRRKCLINCKHEVGRVTSGLSTHLRRPYRSIRHSPVQKACELDLEGSLAKGGRARYDAQQTTWFKIRKSRLLAKTYSRGNGSGSRFRDCIRAALAAPQRASRYTCWSISDRASANGAAHDARLCPRTLRVRVTTFAGTSRSTTTSAGVVCWTTTCSTGSVPKSRAMYSSLHLIEHKCTANGCRAASLVQVDWMLSSLRAEIAPTASVASPTIQDSSACFTAPHVSQTNSSI
jgi:hypothetical protein